MRNSSRLAAIACLLAGCHGSSNALPSQAANGTASSPSGLAAHAIIGFSVDTPARAAKASSEGIDTTILYGGSPPPGSALERALRSHGISVVDAGISGFLFYWECHRTHTVAPPPKSYGRNAYCKTDEDPRFKNEAAVLHATFHLLDRDAARPYVTGYWVLDDWPSWDPGSGRALLQKVHAFIVKQTPGRPAICGFGAGVAKPARVDWDSGTAANYSNDGCDIVGWYNYSPFGRRKPSLGKQLDWSMKALLPAMAHSLAKRGWSISATPLYGIGQAWGGSYGGRYYQPGLTSAEMLAQAKAFCAFGATYIGWYAWDDSGFDARTGTPNNSPSIAAGIRKGIRACRASWQNG
jgi:hypothetical protein